MQTSLLQAVQTETSIPRKHSRESNRSNSILIINALCPRYWQNDWLLFQRATQRGLKKKEQACCFDLELMDGGSRYGWENQRDAQHNHWTLSTSYYLRPVGELLISPFHLPITRSTHKTNNTETQDFSKTTHNQIRLSWAFNHSLATSYATRHSTNPSKRLRILTAISEIEKP